MSCTSYTCLQGFHPKSLDSLARIATGICSRETSAGLTVGMVAPMRQPSGVFALPPAYRRKPASTRPSSQAFDFTFWRHRRKVQIGNGLQVLSSSFMHTGQPQYGSQSDAATIGSGHHHTVLHGAPLSSARLYQVHSISIVISSTFELALQSPLDYSQVKDFLCPFTDCYGLLR